MTEAFLKNRYSNLIMVLCGIGFISAQDIPKRTYRANRLVTNPPKVDGRLNDSCWPGDGWLGDFLQQQPNEGLPGTQETEFKILYDHNYLYVAIRSYDSEPDKMDIRVARKDNFAGDCVGICFDSYYDHRTGYEFNITSGGTKIDLIQMDTGADWFIDRNWDAVWEGKTAIWDSCWTAEMRIPFSQLRFPDKKEHVWGLHVWRWIQRAMEESQFQMIPLDSQGRVHRFGILKGIRDIPTPRRVELLPYVQGSLNRFKPEKGNYFAESGRKWGQGLGLDGRIGLSGNFNLDFTINPDFGQVEADPSVVNLTAFETFYEEKRPFFMEGKQVLDFEIDGQPLFYSRRIGRAPQRYPDLNDQEYADIPDNTTILGAAKISGKTASGWSLGLLSSVTSKENAEIRTGAGSREETAEPFSNYTVGRLQRDFHRGNHSVGAIFTAVHRNIQEDDLDFLPTSAYTGGVDGTFQWGNRTYYINTKHVFSHVHGHRDAIHRLQASSVHHFQRTDADHVDVDSALTSMSGFGGEFEIGKGGNGRWRYKEEITWLSPGLELNDLGYLRQADQISQETEIAYVVTEPTRRFASYQWSFEQSNSWDFNKQWLGSRAELFGSWTFKNYWSFHGYIQHEFHRSDTRLLRGGPAMRLPDVTYLHYHLNSDSRKRYQYSLAFTHALFNDNVSDYWTVWGDLYFRASDNLDFSIAPQYTVNRDAWQYVGLETMTNDVPYILGLIDQKTLSFTLRFNYYLTPDLSIQYYGQPFISAGHYSDYKRITDSKASAFDDRYTALSENQLVKDAETGDLNTDENLDGIVDYTLYNPNFNFREFRSNLVLRWEYRPGSTLYLVWTHGRSQTIRNGAFNFNHDMEELFGIYPNNVFMMKLNYWFSM